MARTSNITFGQVAAIADAMKAAGNRPTARAVRERIGSGSMGTIHKFLQQWQGNNIAEGIEAPELPESIASALMDFVSTEVATACEPLNELLRHAKEDADEIALDNERLNRTIEQQGDDITIAMKELAAARAELNLTRHALAESNAHLAEANTRNTEYLRDLDRAQRQIEMLASLQLDIVQARTALTSSETARIDAERSAAVLSAQLEAKNERAADLEARLIQGEKIHNALVVDFQRVTVTAQRATAELGSVARELAEVKAAAAPMKVVKSAEKKITAKKPANQELAV